MVLAVSGTVRLVIVTGSSMEPRLSSGDVAVTLAAATYRVGDVVAYRDPTIGTVLHRLNARDGERFVASGDANDWIDGYQPTGADIGGRVILVVPGLGSVMRLVREPPITAFLAILGVLALTLRVGRDVVWITGAALLAGLCFAVAARGGFTGANAVPPTGAGMATAPITADLLKPTLCAGISLQALVIGGGVVAGTSANELILGGPGNDTLSGEPSVTGVSAGNDCIVGGSGVDTIHGDSTLAVLVGGNDVLIGGPGNDGLTGGVGTDVCHAGGGVDTYSGCEGIVP